MVIFASMQEKWHISAAYDYIADNLYTRALADLYDKKGKARCPQDLEYKLWLNEKWTSETDLSVSSSMKLLS